MLARRPANRFHRGRFGGAPGFTGNFAQFFTSLGLASNLLQLVQSDLGGTYGGTLQDVGGAGPVCTLTGTLNAGLPIVPLLLKCTLGGALGVWTWSLYSDGGTTPFQTGTSAAGPTALTGAGAGLSLSIAAGVAVLNNAWNGTSAAWADQSGNAKDYSQGNATLQFKYVVGINGKAGLTPVSTAGFMDSALNLPAPGTTPTFAWGIVRQMAWSASTILVSASAATEAHMIFATGVTPSLSQYSGVTVNANTGAPVNSPARIEAYFNNSAVNDYLKCGSALPTSGSAAGNNASTGRRIGKDGAGAVAAAVEHYVWAYLNTLPSASQLAALSAAAQVWGGSGVLI